ncbi:MAG TPA: START-like domain-containing protein [Flavobacterium sp.]|nr:START-like domain-containing protein [Flavobacterium sp.]
MEDKIKYEMEFPLTVSPQLLYQYISTASELAEWFADNVNSRGEVFTFIWEGEEQKAKISIKKSVEKVRFRWLDENEKEGEYYFEFRIQEDELTKDVSLVVTDFAEEGDLEGSKQLWETQIADLKQVLGSA